MCASLLQVLAGQKIGHSPEHSAWHRLSSQELVWGTAGWAAAGSILQSWDSSEGEGRLGRSSGIPRGVIHPSLSPQSSAPSTQGCSQEPGWVQGEHTAGSSSSVIALGNPEWGSSPGKGRVCPGEQDPELTLAPGCLRSTQTSPSPPLPQLLKSLSGVPGSPGIPEDPSVEGKCLSSQAELK